MIPNPINDEDLTDCGAPQPELGEEILTVCGEVSHYSVNTPCIQIRDKTFFFCLPICREDLVYNCSISSRCTPKI
jgi:hypothetical protein